jgi:hypothetical protein
LIDLTAALRHASPVGKRWASNFVRRHLELKTRFFRKYDYQRAKCEDPTIIRDWFRLVENTIAKYGITLADIYNFGDWFYDGPYCKRNGCHGCTKAWKPEINPAWKPGMGYSHPGD